MHLNENKKVFMGMIGGSNGKERICNCYNLKEKIAKTF